MATTTTRKLIVEVVEARDLLPIDGHGTSSPYVVVDYYGQRKRTHTVVRDLNPTWNQVLEFNIGQQSDVFTDELELNVFHDLSVGPTRRNNILGRLRVSSVHFVKKGEEALIYFRLEKKQFLRWTKAEIGLKIYYLDEILPPPQPEEPPRAEETESKPSTDTAAALAEAKKAPAADLPKPNEDAPAVDEPKPNEDPSPAEPPASGQKPNGEPSPAEATTLDKETETSPESEIGRPNQEETPTQANPPTEPTTVPADSNEIKLMPASASKSAPEVKFVGINGQQPVKRPVARVSHTLDPSESLPIERSSFDLVEKMHYLFVRVVKARSLPTNGCPVVKVEVSGQQVISRPARKTNLFEWDQTFAFVRVSPESSPILEVSVWETPPSDVSGGNLLGVLCFDVSEIPVRDPPDSPLALQWYRLEGDGTHNGHLMLATWVGTQADEAFPDAWKTDTAGDASSRAKVYQSPKLWYLRATVLEAQDIRLLGEASFRVTAHLGVQVSKTKFAVSRNGAPTWNEDLMFIAAEPLGDNLVFTIESRRGTVDLGITKVPLIDIERRVDDRKVSSKWFNLQGPGDEKVGRYNGRIHLRLCFDGGYHVMDEAAQVCSDYRPTAKQLAKPPLGTIELGIIGCKNLIPMKMVNGKSCTDAYCVAKYGSKWIRTRTISDSLEPKWNEQYTWRVHDPCTVLSIGVFDSWGVFEIDDSKEALRPDFRVGKIRVRISTLETGKVYRTISPLLVLSNSGMKKMGELEIAIRFVRTTPRLDFIQVYFQPLLPLMHHKNPLGVLHQEMLRNAAAQILAAHLSLSEPPLRREVVLYMLDADSQTFSMRKLRANWLRIINVVAGVIDVIRWVEDTRSWKNPTATILVHALLVMLVWFPDLIIPTLAFYVFVVGAWNYRFRRSRDLLVHFDPRVSLADAADREELDEEFDTLPSSRSAEVIRARYDKLRALGARVQTVLGDVATQGERVQALVTWRDPRATGIFVGLCFVVAMVMYMVPSKMVAMAFGFYYLRHPIFRDRMPSPALNFFRRLPSLAERLM